MKKTFKDIFITKTRDEWTHIFKDLDACFSPILEPQEAPQHLHNIANKTFLKNEKGEYEPGPAPRLSRTPGIDQVHLEPVIGQHSVSIMKNTGYNDDEIERLLKAGVIEQKNSKL